MFFFFFYRTDVFLLCNFFVLILSNYKIMPNAQQLRNKVLFNANAHFLYYIYKIRKKTRKINKKKNRSKSHR